MKGDRQKTGYSFFIRTIAEINTKNFSSKFGKQKCTVINK